MAPAASSAPVVPVAERRGMKGAAALACSVAASTMCFGGEGSVFSLPTGVTTSSFGCSSQAKLRGVAVAGEAPHQHAARGGAELAGVALVGTAAAAASLTRNRMRARNRRATAVRAVGDVIDTEGGMMTEGVDYMTVVPEGGVADEDKIQIPRFIYEGTKEVKLDGREKTPQGQSTDPDNLYFWKMAKDKRTIEVVFPIDDDVKSDHIIYRLGEEPLDARRGPTLELGYRAKNENGRFTENLVIDGQILNSVNRDDSFWTIDDIEGVRVCVLSLARPSMLRQRHDPILKRSTEEERIEPQTWDALLVEERPKPKITHKAFFDLSLDGETGKRLEFGLYGDIVPKTVKNFMGLVTGEYENDDGEVCKSAHCYKGTPFQTVMRDLLIGCGNPGLDHVMIDFSAEELLEYSSFFKDFSRQPEKIGKVEPNWAIRWGADLGRPVDEDGIRRKEGSSIDGNSEQELAMVVEIMDELVEKGEGAKFIFFRPEFDKGVDCTGNTFPAEALKLSHSKRGIISMDRKEDDDIQGSSFFITMREIPEMDTRWCVFGEVIGGNDVLNELEDNFDSMAHKVIIEDCGVLE